MNDWYDSEESKEPLDIFLPIGTCMNRSNQDAVCSRCGNDAWIPLKAQAKHSAGDAVPCRWCEWGRTVVARFEADGRKGGWFDYQEDDVMFVSQELTRPPLRDDEKRRMWADYGFRFLDDGTLVNAATGAVVPLQLPKSVLVPNSPNARPDPNVSTEGQKLPPPPEPPSIPEGAEIAASLLEELPAPSNPLDRLPPKPDDFDQVPF